MQGHFNINNYFLYVTKTQAYKWKTEKFFVSEEKKFGRIDTRFIIKTKLWYSLYFELIFIISMSIQPRKQQQQI